jgi:large subunit ribosomal protein L3
MPGQMGNETVSVQNLKVFGTNEEDNLIYVEGAVPGANGAFVLVSDSVKKELAKDLPVPTAEKIEKKQETSVSESPAEEVAAE